VAPIRLTILGSTGSIGRSALDVVRSYPGQFEIVGLAAGSRIAELSRQVEEFRPRRVAVADLEAADRFSDMAGGAEVLRGEEGLCALAETPTDVVLNAIVGSAGLHPVLRAIDAGNRIALANKEPVVMAGPLILDRARSRGVAILPVDSEHSAVFQCLQGHRIEDVECIYLTASGGPFYGRDRDSLRSVTWEEAVTHPTWDMGQKVSIDSATLMNKGLEVIEAMRFFNVPVEKVRVLIHPQSVVHSLVEFTDGNILAHLGVTDMRFPILFALTWPSRVQTPMARLDMTRLADLSFAAPDLERFPCLDCAFQAARADGLAPAALSAADEVAVGAFSEGRIGFLQISDIVCNVLDAHLTARDSCGTDSFDWAHPDCLSKILEADAEARIMAEQLVDSAAKGSA